MTSTNNKLSITVIYGRAGTGKSTLLANMISNCIRSNSTYVVLTSTHSSLNNIFSIVNGLISTPPPRNQFRTIYSFFRINYENDTILGAVSIPEYIFIDEFSLINKHLFKRILSSISSRLTQNVKITLTGDALQLNSVYRDKQYISFPKLSKLSSLYNPPKPLYPSVIEHIHLSIFGLKPILSSTLHQLTVNHRNSSFITSVLNAIYSENKSFKYPFIDYLHELIPLIVHRNYIFICSKYKLIQHIYDHLSKYWIENNYELKTIKQDITYRCGLKRLYLYPGIELMLTITSKRKNNLSDPVYYNGEYVTWNGVIESNGDLTCTNSFSETIYVSREYDESIPSKPFYYPVIPKSLITIHKSQGQTIDNVVVCIDEMFDISMLYTAITRCKSNLSFFTLEGSTNRVERLINCARVTEFKQLNALLTKISSGSTHESEPET